VLLQAEDGVFEELAVFSLLQFGLDDFQLEILDQHGDRGVAVQLASDAPLQNLPQRSAAGADDNSAAVSVRLLH
jgi:hypothetical protein